VLIRRAFAQPDASVVGKGHGEGFGADRELDRLLVPQCGSIVERDLQLIASFQRRIPVADVDALRRRRIQRGHEQQTASEKHVRAPERMTCVHW
jgi:hypothetical protein